MVRALDGSGSGYGYDSGSGSGYGYGYGYGSGYGDGSGEYWEAIGALAVDADLLLALGACKVDGFRAAFPRGATWPDDEQMARDAGLDVDWFRSRLGVGK